MKFSINEIIDMAVELEKTGFEFYTECSKYFSSNSKQSEFFLKLASEENNHKQIFTSMLENLPETEGNFPDEYYEYLSAIISGRIFKNNNDIKTFLNNLKDEDDILKAALNAEKDSVLWYSELKSVYPQNDKANKILDDIIQEEKSHILQISKMFEK